MPPAPTRRMRDEETRLVKKEVPRTCEAKELRAGAAPVPAGALVEAVAAAAEAMVTGSWSAVVVEMLYARLVVMEGKEARGQ